MKKEVANKIKEMFNQYHDTEGLARQEIGVRILAFIEGYCEAIISNNKSN